MSAGALLGLLALAVAVLVAAVIVSSTRLRRSRSYLVTDGAADVFPGIERSEQGPPRDLSRGGPSGRATTTEE